MSRYIALTFFFGFFLGITAFFEKEISVATISILSSINMLGVIILDKLDEIEKKLDQRINNQTDQ